MVWRPFRTSGRAHPDRTLSPAEGYSHWYLRKGATALGLPVQSPDGQSQPRRARRCARTMLCSGGARQMPAIESEPRPVPASFLSQGATDNDYVNCFVSLHSSWSHHRRTAPTVTSRRTDRPGEPCAGGPGNRLGDATGPVVVADGDAVVADGLGDLDVGTLHARHGDLHLGRCWNRHMFQKASPMVRPTVRTPWFRITSTVFSRPRLARSRGFSLVGDGDPLEGVVADPAVELRRVERIVIQSGLLGGDGLRSVVCVCMTQMASSRTNGSRCG